MPDIPCPLREAARHNPSLTALDAGGHRFTYLELDEWVQGTANRLAAEGLRPGDRLALWMENDWRMVVLLLASLRAGVVVCPLSTRLPAIEANLDMLSAAVLISDRLGRAPEDYVERAVAQGDTAHPHARPATIIFTTGSSGRPKAVLHSYANHYYSAIGSNRNISVKPHDRWLVSIPMYHVGGIAIIFRCLIGRGTITLRPKIPLKEAILQVTHASLVSTQLLRLMQSDVSVEGLKAVLLGGSGIPAQLINSALERRLPIHTSYGLTEMASQVATTRPSPTRKELRTSGRVLPHRELKIASDGMILVRGKTRFLGYVDGRDLIEPFRPDGWYATGDIGRWTENDHLEVLGRIDNMFVSGGENVMPEEIEDALTAIEGVERAVVVGIDHEEFGRRPVAFLDAGDLTLDPAGLRAVLALSLPGFKVPVRFFPWPYRDAPSGMKVDRAFFEREASALMRRASS